MCAGQTEEKEFTRPLLRYVSCLASRIPHLKREALLRRVEPELLGQEWCGVELNSTAVKVAGLIPANAPLHNRPPWQRHQHRPSFVSVAHICQGAHCSFIKNSRSTWTYVLRTIVSLLQLIMSLRNCLGVSGTSGDSGTSDDCSTLGTSGASGISNTSGTSG